MHFKIHYKPGKTNIVADALSRFPMVSPNNFHLRGLIAVLKVLLDNLNEPTRVKDQIWFTHHSHQPSQELARVIRDWQNVKSVSEKSDGQRTKRKTILIKSWKTSKFNDVAASANFSILMPEPHEAPILANKMIKLGREFAILIPTDLVHFVAKATDLGFEAKVQQSVDDSSKLTMSVTNHTWLIHSKRNKPPHQFFMSHATEIESCIDVKKWVLEQKEEFESIITIHGETGVSTRGDGLVFVHEPKSGKSKIWVPKSQRKKLVEHTHLFLKHLGHTKVRSELQKSFTWPHMRSDCEKHSVCGDCVLAKAKRNLAHGKFSAVEAKGPHESFGVDFYSIPETMSGNTQILTIVDLFSSFVQFVPCRDRTADEFIEKFKNNVLFKTGAPLRVHSDDAQEFRSEVTKLLASKLSIKHTTTLGYNPQGNAKTERTHLFLGNCMRTMSDEQYYNIESELPAIAHAWNSSQSESLGCSPFEIHHGVKARSIPEAALASLKEAPFSLPKSLESVRDHVKFYKNLAMTHGKFMSKLRAKKLNATRKQSPFKVGDKVMIYVPPSHHQAKARHRKVKHMLHFRGPGTITKELGDRKAAFEIKMDNSGAVFQRTLINIKRFPKLAFTKSKTDLVMNEQGTVRNAQGTVFHFGKFKPGTIIALIDNEGSRKFRLGKVTKQAGDWHTVHLFAAQTRNKRAQGAAILPTCTFKLAHIDSLDNTVVFNKRHKKWTMQFDTRERLVIAVNVELSRAKMTTQSMTQIPKGFVPILS